MEFLGAFNGDLVSRVYAFRKTIQIDYGGIGNIGQYRVCKESLMACYLNISEDHTF
jgi:hypothetical protein